MTTTAFFSESGRFFGLYRMTLRRSRGYMYLLSSFIRSSTLWRRSNHCARTQTPPTSPIITCMVSLKIIRS